MPGRCQRSHTAPRTDQRHEMAAFAVSVAVLEEQRAISGSRMAKTTMCRQIEPGFISVAQRRTSIGAETAADETFRASCR
jgi:hypothetical protein